MCRKEADSFDNIEMKGLIIESLISVDYLQDRNQIKLKIFELFILE